ncbi:hypothetical protein [Niveispirillum fermenti]|uniref:hypothetical protein n=1 Tax=Niveispirillum fermenti TaxID=1233113 RepID=UPI0040412B69
MTAPALLVALLLMFIGGGPASTAGGIKVSTAVVLFAVTVAHIRRRQTVSVGPGARCHPRRSSRR